MIAQDDCSGYVVLSAYGVAPCDQLPGHDGPHDTKAFDADLWQPTSTGSADQRPPRAVLK